MTLTPSSEVPMWLRVVLALSAVAAAGVADAQPVAAQAAITCESRDNQYQDCRVATRGSVRMDRQISQAPCLHGRTWGFDYNSVWVDRGCRARFVVGGSGSGWERGDWGRRITCESRDGQPQFCNVNTHGDVRLVRQLSNSPCVAQRTWGFTNRGIWVDGGCRAEFEIGYSAVEWGNGNRRVRCESEDNSYRRCRVWTYGEVTIYRQLSRTTCRRNVNWGHDRNGIWVNDGCRAEFLVGAGGGGWGEPGGSGGGNAVVRGRQACENRARGMGYQSVSVASAGQRGSEVEVSMRARQAGTNWLLRCKYRIVNNSATITDQSRDTGPGGNVQQAARNACSDKARALGYQVMELGEVRQAKEAVTVRLVLRRGASTYPKADCNYLIRDRVATVVPGSAGPR